MNQKQESERSEPPSIPSIPKKRGNFAEFVRGLLRQHRKNAVLTMIFYICKQSPVWIMPILVGRMLDLITKDEGSRLPWLMIYTGITLLLVIQNVPTHWMHTRYMSRITRGIGRDLRVALCRQLQRLTLLYHDTTSVGRLQAKAIRDVEMLENAPRFFVDNVLQFVAQVSVAVVAIFWRAPGALLFFALFVPLAVWITRIFRHKIRERVHEYRGSLEGMSSRLNDMLTMIPVTRAHAVEDEELENVSNKINEVSEKGYRFDIINALFAASSWVTMNSMQVIFLTGCIIASFEGHISVGDVLMFNGFFAGLSGTLNGLLNTLPMFSQARESVYSILEVLNAPDIEENAGKSKFERVDGTVTFEHVTYQYPRSDRPAIADFTLEVPEGTSVALIGPSGSGKSTLLSLLLGFVRPTEGRILLDGQDYAEMDLRTMRARVGVVTQDTVFFSGTIMDNVNFGVRHADEELIVETLKIANAWEFVKELPEGIYTRIGEDGIKLSGGQRQRLAIARALFRNPRILILDEATSALDVESEYLVQEALQRVMANRTTFIVSHRLSTIRHADQIVILEEGRIVERGSHAALMDGSNFYSRAMEKSMPAGGKVQ